MVGNGAEVPASEERPASRAKVALNMRAANRRLDEHGVRAQVGDGQRARARAFKSCGEGGKRSPVWATKPVLMRSTKASAQGLSEEDVFEGIAEGNVSVDEVERRGREDRAVAWSIEALELHNDGPNEEARFGEGGLSSGRRDR